MFTPKSEYNIVQRNFKLKEFFDYKEGFIFRPPYQRKAGVWSKTMKINFLESICKQYYIPRIVLRQVRLKEDEIKWEIIDGQQRITTIIEFFEGKIKLPETLKTIDKNNDLINKSYGQLKVNIKKWFDQDLFLNADLITNIEQFDSSVHLRKASELFWRLQQGEPLKFIEILHSRLHSNVRNFVSKYADDISFDYIRYEQVEENKNIHKYFEKIVDMNNDRMQHLLLLARFLIIEFAGEITDVGQESIKQLFEKEEYFVKGGEADSSQAFESLQGVKSCLKMLNLFYDVFKEDPIIDKNNGVKELKNEYFVISVYLLLRYLKQYYVLGKSEYKMFREFVSGFYIRCEKAEIDDQDILLFTESRQQEKGALEIRDMIIKQAFFNENKKFKLLDSKRMFDECEKIQIYRRDKGICKKCLKEGKNEKMSTVSWSDYEADHILAHTNGGKTTVDQGQVLCILHNRKKGAL